MLDPLDPKTLRQLLNSPTSQGIRQGMLPPAPGWMDKPLIGKLTRGGAITGAAGLMAAKTILDQVMQNRMMNVERDRFRGEAELGSPENLLAQMRLPDVLAERRMAREALVQHLLGITGPSLPRGMQIT